MPSNERYSSQVKLPGFGVRAQAKLKNAKVVVVGLGGLGCPASQYLVRAGIGNLKLVDFDKISASNLHRQILYTEKSIGKYKVDTAADALREQNSDVNITTTRERINSDNVLSIIMSCDIVVDCTDNFEARYMLNDACVLSGKPLVYGAAYQFEGQVSVWNCSNKDGTRSPHYRDIFPSPELNLDADCNSGGVIPTLTGVIGCMEANEVIKYIADLPGLLCSQLLVFNSLTMQSKIIVLPTTSHTSVTELSRQNNEITVDDLRSGLASDTYNLVDVRSNQERLDFNIGGRHIPLPEILSGKIEPDFDKPIIFYCATGKRSATAVTHTLNNRPEANVLSLSGGIEAWRKTK